MELNWCMQLAIPIEFIIDITNMYFVLAFIRIVKLMAELFFMWYKKKTYLLMNILVGLNFHVQ